jgi:tetratricopeptide (TPR) repeat protein
MDSPGDSQVLRNEEAPRLRFRAGRPRFLLFWTLVPAFCLLLALTGIFLSLPWPGNLAPEWNAARLDGGNKAALSSSVSSRPEGARRPEPARQEPGDGTAPLGLPSNSPMAEAFWSAASGPEAPCDLLVRLQSERNQIQGEVSCSIFPHWIEYLTLETAPSPVCDLEPAFSIAADSLRQEALCAQGHAFLASYYLRKGLIQRSRSYLDQALGMAPDDPWIKLVEAVLHERAYYDDQQAIRILAELTRRQPGFRVARYLLGKAHIRQGEYREASASFEFLKENAPGQVAFWRIRRALSSLEQALGNSVEQAEALLALSRAFNTLRDYPMAQDLYRWVLEEMPDRLPRGDRMAAYCELGEIYMKRGDNNGAYQAYQNALQIDPECQTAREGLRGLMPEPPDRSGG